MFLAAEDRLDRYFAGTSFQQAFWDLLREIPFGSVVTYGDLTRALAQRQGRTSLSPQAVGGAVGRTWLHQREKT